MKERAGDEVEREEPEVVETDPLYHPWDEEEAEERRRDPLRGRLPADEPEEEPGEEPGEER
jgi:hypothetical protein